MAATLAVGGLRGLSHRSAAALWGLASIPNAPIEIVVAGGSRTHRRGLITHRSTCLTPQELTKHRGIPVTTVARTLVDLATRVRERELKEAFYRAESRRLLQRPTLSHCLTRARARHGSGVLRKLLADRPLPLADANPGLKRSLLRFCPTHGVPIPEVDVPFGDFTVDCLTATERSGDRPQNEARRG